MTAAPSRPRGRPPRLKRDIALALALEWHRQAEGLSTDCAAHAVTGLWQSRGRAGLGRPGKPSKAIYRSLAIAAEHLGEGRFVVLRGIEVAGNFLDAACFFVPTGSTIGPTRDGRNRAIRGPAWRWPFGAEEAELLHVDT